uniref:ARAD1C05654p n=1 Tax=Blastobotrys adeninivorans TaxID=409370 RepID=A0A060T5I1_BLAAD
MSSRRIPLHLQTPDRRDSPLRRLGSSVLQRLGLRKDDNDNLGEWMRSIRERGRNALERDEMLAQQLKEEEEERDREREQELANELRGSTSFERLGSILSGYFTPQKQTAEREDSYETTEHGNGRRSDHQDDTFDRSDQAQSQSESESESESDVDAFDGANGEGEESMYYDVSDVHESGEGTDGMEESEQEDNELVEARERRSVDEGGHYEAESDEGSEEADDTEEKYDQTNVSMQNDAPVVEILSSSDEEAQEKQDNTPEEHSDKEDYDDYDNEDFVDHEHMGYHGDHNEENYHEEDYQEEDYHDDVEMEEVSQEDYLGNENDQTQPDHALGVSHLPASFHELLHEGESAAQHHSFHDQMSHMDPMIIEEGLFVGDGVEYDSYAPVADALLQMRSSHGSNINMDAASDSGNVQIPEPLPTECPANGIKEHVVPVNVSEPVETGNEQTVSELVDTTHKKPVDKVPEPSGASEQSQSTEQEEADGSEIDKKAEEGATDKKRVDVASLVQHKDIPTFAVSSKKEFNPFYSDESDNEEAVNQIQNITTNAFKKLHSLNLNFSFGSTSTDTTVQAPPIEKHGDDANASEISQSPAPALPSRQFRPKGLDTPKLPVAAVNHSPIEFIGFSDKALGLAPNDDQDKQEQESAEERDEILEEEVVQESTIEKAAEAETITNGKTPADGQMDQDDHTDDVEANEGHEAIVESTEHETPQKLSNEKESNEVEPLESRQPAEPEADGGAQASIPDSGPAVQEDAEKDEDGTETRAVHEPDAVDSKEDSIGARVAREHEMEAEAKAEEAEETEAADPQSENLERAGDEQEGEEMDIDTNYNNDLGGVEDERAAPEAAVAPEMESGSNQDNQKDAQPATKEIPVPRRTLRSGKIIGQPEPVEPARKQLRSSSKKPDPIKPARQSARVRQKKKQDADPAEPTSEPIDSSSVQSQAVERSEPSPEPSRKRKVKETKPKPSPKKPKRRRVNLNKK